MCSEINLPSKEINADKTSMFVDFLNHEIDYICDKEKTPGWNKWVLGGSVASLLWLMSKEIGTSPISIDKLSVLYIFISFYFILDFLSISYSLSDSTIKSTSPRFFTLSKIQNNIKQCSFWSIIKQTVLIIGIWILNRHFNVPGLCFLLFYFAVKIFFVIAGLVLSFKDIPFYLRNRKSKLSTILIILCACVPIVGLFFISKVYFQNNLQLHAVEYRVAGIIIVLIVLIDIFLSLKKNEAMLPELVSIRRQLSMGTIDVNTAIARTEIVLLGMKLDDIFQDNIKDILALFRSIEEHFNTMKDTVVLLQKIDKAESHSADEKVLIKSALDSLLYHKDEITKLKQEKSLCVDGFHKKYKLIYSMNRDLKNDLEKIKGKIDAAFDNVKATAKQLMEETDRLCSKTDSGNLKSV